MTDAARLLVRILADPSSAIGLRPDQWTTVITAARAEQLIGNLANRLLGLSLPAKVQQILEDAQAAAQHQRLTALWEVEMTRRALKPLGIPIILLKGSAFAAAGLDAGSGRSIGDLDILVPRDALPEVERALLNAGWEWVKEDVYDDLYYRQWMHELPPLIHRARDRMIDVHHSILPPTSRRRPDIEAMIASRVALNEDLSILTSADVVIHAAAHLFADGDLSGGLRNLWDIDRLLQEFGEEPKFWDQLASRMKLHRLTAATQRALRLTARIYKTPIPSGIAGRTSTLDALYQRRLLARDGWGRETRPFLRFIFYLRSHLIRMPLPLLAHHLWIKSRKSRKGRDPVITQPAS